MHVHGMYRQQGAVKSAASYLDLFFQQCGLSWCECILVQPKAQGQAIVCLHAAPDSSARRGTLDRTDLLFTLRWFQTCWARSVVNRSVFTNSSSAGATFCMQGLLDVSGRCEVGGSRSFRLIATVSVCCVPRNGDRDDKTVCRQCVWQLSSCSLWVWLPTEAKRTPPDVLTWSGNAETTPRLDKNSDHACCRSSRALLGQLGQPSRSPRCHA